MTASYSDGVSNTTNSEFILVWTSAVSLIDPLAEVRAPLNPMTILEYGRKKLVGMTIYSRVLLKRMLMALPMSTRTFGIFTLATGIGTTRTSG